jgi:hypothetical protein
MVEQQALFEWSPEIALSLGIKFCSWVVPECDELEEDSDDDQKKITTEITKSESILIKQSIAMGVDLTQIKTQTQLKEDYQKAYQDPSDNDQIDVMTFDEGEIDDHRQHQEEEKQEVSTTELNEELKQSEQVDT